MKARRSEAAEGLELLIEDGFRGVLREEGVTLHQMDVLDGHGSHAEMTAALRLDPESNWQEIGDAKLMAFGTSLVFLDAKGFRFYLPAYMRLIARRLVSAKGSSDLCGVWSALAGGSYYCERHYALLSLAQNQIIAKFLWALSELGDPDERQDAAECLQSFWHAYL